MEILDRLLSGLSVGFTPEALLIVAGGVIVGILAGAAPGMGPTVGMAIMLPFALRMDSPEHAVFFLSAILVGVNYGNGIPSILIRVPGSPSAIITAMEGYPFQQRGEGGKALMLSLLGATVGQMVGVLLFVLFVVPLAAIAIQLLWPELTAIIILGLLSSTGLVTKSPVKGLMSVAFGLLLSVPGHDPVTNVRRLTFGSTELTLGLGLIPMIVGLLAFREVYALASEGGGPTIERDTRRVPKFPSFRGVDVRALIPPISVGATIGAVIGMIPGAGGTIAQFVCYNPVKFVSKDKHLAGKGSAGLLAGTDASGNGAAAGELVPTFGLGIPGAAPMVLIMAALTAHGLFVGPQLLQSRPDLLYSVFGGLMAATVLLAVIGYLLIWPSVYIASLSRAATVTFTLVLIIVGVYALRWSMFDVWVAILVGLVGFVLSQYGYPVAPAALAFVLGNMLETNARRGLLMTEGYLGFVSRPITAVLLLVALAVVIGPPLRRRWSRGRAAGGGADGEGSGTSTSPAEGPDGKASMRGRGSAGRRRSRGE